MWIKTLLIPSILNFIPLSSWFPFFILPISPRIASELQKVSAQANEQKMQADLQSMNEWCNRYSEYGNRQGGLDMRYIGERYSKGVAKVSEWMSEKHRFSCSDNFDSMQATIVQMCNSMNVGPQPLRGLQTLFFFHSWTVFYRFKDSRLLFIIGLQVCGAVAGCDVLAFQLLRPDAMIMLVTLCICDDMTR